MLRSNTHVIAGAALLATLLAAGTLAQAATVTLDDAEARRVLDLNSSGTGDTAELSVLDAGFYGDSFQDNTHPVFVFQMTGVANPAGITTADFTVTQAVFGTIDFDVVAHVIRTSASATILNSDYENSAGLLMTNFDNGNINGSVSLNAGGETALGAYLLSNWVTGNYVFLTLKTSPLTLTGATKVLRYGNTSPTWSAGDTDAQITVNYTPVPSPAALPAGLAGLGLICLRRRCTR